MLKFYFEYTRDDEDQPYAVTCDIYDTSKPINEDFIGSGESYCNPVDQFSKKRGRKIALKRAIEHLSREERKVIWEAYFKRSKV